jgi:hypothetical protein
LGPSYGFGSNPSAGSSVIELAWISLGNEAGARRAKEPSFPVTNTD